MATESSRIGRALLLGSGLLYLVAALLYDPHLLAPLARGAFAPGTLARLRDVRIDFAAAGALLILASYGLPRFTSLLSSPRAASVLLVLLALIVPLSLLDCGLRPFVDPKTTLYAPDSELGWKLVPGVEDEYGGVHVRINALGLRGPEVADPKPPGVKRILWLGDSVTFGYGVEREEELFPSRVAQSLAAESVNAGVGGYAPWQELAWLEREGWSYEPDLIVVGFVLNDLTEPMSLVRYGGTGEGWQRARRATGWLDRWLSESALATFLRDGIATLRFGRDVQLGAQHLDVRDVRRMVAEPDAELWSRSWRITESNLTRMFASARARGVPVALVVFPYAFQLEAPGALGGPQQRVAAIANAAGVPVLDLLPDFASKGGALFLDASHLSAAGHAIAAERIEAFLRERGLVGTQAE